MFATPEQRAAEYATDKAWRKANPEKVREKDKRAYRKLIEKNPACRREYNKTRKDYFAKYMREWRESDPVFRLNDCIRKGISHSLAEGKNGQHWEDLVGYTLDDLKRHLESQFHDDMNWDNMGRDGWTIDHVKPIAAHSFISPDDPEFKECWALSNLRPMWFRDNCVKGARYQGIDYRYKSKGVPQ